MPATEQIQLPSGYEDAKPAVENNAVQLPPGYEDAKPVQTKSQQPSTGEHDPNARFFAGTKPAEISAGKSGVGSWLEGAENDLRYGGESTVVGKVMRSLGAPGIRRGVSEQTGDLLGGVVEAPVHAAQAAHELATGHPIKAVNKVAQTVGDVALPAAVVAPEMLPLMTPRIGGAIVGSKVAGAVAPYITDDPDKQELISNTGGAVGAASPEILEHGTAPAVRGAAKTYNAARKAAPVIAPVVGAAEGYARGGLPGMAYGAVTGGTLGKIPKLLPEAPEALTHYGLKRIAIPDESSTIPLRKGTEPAASGDTIPLRSEKPAAPAEPKPLPKPKTYSEAQARHVLGDVVTDKLKSTEGGGDALQRLANGSHQQYADLANASDVKKPKALAAKNGPDWTATELRRSSLEHGKELNPLKEQIARHMLENHSPTEILQHTEHWVNPDAQPIKPMSSLTERTMSALQLSEEAKNQMRSSGVSDSEAQSLLSKLSARQLENLGKK